MRNLLKYPITRTEARDCLLRLRGVVAKDDEMAMSCGSLDTYILAGAAYAIMGLSDEALEEAFGITDDTESNNADSQPK